MRSPRELAEEQAWLIAASLMIIATVATGVALVYMRPALVPFVLAVVLYYLVSPLADLLETRARFPRWASTIATLVVVAVIIALTGLLIVTSMRGALESADIYRDRLVEVARRVLQFLEGHGFDVEQQTLLDAIRPAPMRDLLQSTAATGLKLVTNSVLVLIFVIFLLLGRQKEMIKSAVFREIDAGIRRFLVLKFLISAATGIIVGTTLGLLRLELALVFGILTFFLNFIPSVGSIVAWLLPIPVALVQYDTLLPVLAVIILPGITQMVIGNGIDPKVMGRGLDLSPVTVVLALVFWGLVWGIAGMLLAAPLTAALRIVLAQFATTRPVSELLAGRLPEGGQTGTWPVADPAGAGDRPGVPGFSPPA